MDRRRSHLAARVALAGLSIALGVSAAMAQIRVSPIELDTGIGVARGYIAEIDLTDDRLAVVVGSLAADGGSIGAVRLVSPELWAASSGCDLVVNANFFASKGDGSADIVGLCVADGLTVSEARSFQGEPDPVLVFFDDGRAAIGRGVDETDATRVVHAVAGVGGSTTSSLAGDLLVTDGVNTGATTRVQPDVRHPRTAAGVSADGTTLYLVVIDGRREGWSVGVTLPELADLLIDHGADDAVNLDGGGSTAFVSTVGGELVTNQPSDGTFRPVAVVLGFRITEREPAGEAG